MSALQNFITNPSNHELLALVKGARNGLVYGTKVRFPHALVMTFLFSNKSLPAKIKGIFLATRTHAFNLAKFVTIYKVFLLLQKKMNGGKERDLDSLIAGGLGGWWVFGERTAIVLYVLSRTLVSLLPRLYSTTPNPPALPFSPLEHPLPPLTSKAANPGPIPIAPMPFAIVAAASWAGVMYMFRHRGERLQAGMGNSMRYLYHDSEVWSDLRTLLWHNQ